MGINSITSILRGMRSSGKAIDKQLVELCHTLSKSKIRTHSTRLPVSGKDIDTLLPKPFRQLVAGLKNPTVTVGYNAGRGQSVLGMTIREGNRPLGGIAYSLDFTRGKNPILQTKYKFQMPNASAERVMSGSLTLNPNATISDDFVHLSSKRNGIYQLEHTEGHNVHIGATFNEKKSAEFSQITGLEMPNADGLAQMPQVVAGETQSLMDEFLLAVQKRKPKQKILKTKPASKPKVVKAPITAQPQRTSFANEAKEIIAFEGSTSVESANKAKDLLMKRMGYDPKLLTVKGKDLTNEAGYAYFDALTGEITVDSAMAGKATHFDVADVLLHELQHMDDHVKLCKKMGIDEYEKLIMQLAGKEKAVFNRAFYEKAIQQADITGFDAKPLIKELKTRSKYASRKLTLVYETYLYKYDYATSEMERRARQAEKRLISELQTDGVKIKSSMPLGRYGATPDEHLIDIMPKIESKLSRYPLAKRNDIFNKAHDEVLAKINPEFAGLLKKLKTEGELTGKDSERFNELNKTLGGKDFEIKVLNKILELI